jgi:hypothetical protein
MVILESFCHSYLVGFKVPVGDAGLSTWSSGHALYSFCRSVVSVTSLLMMPLFLILRTTDIFLFSVSVSPLSLVTVAPPLPHAIVLVACLLKDSEKQP